MAGTFSIGLVAPYYAKESDVGSTYAVPVAN